MTLEVVGRLLGGCWGEETSEGDELTLEENPPGARQNTRNFIHRLADRVVGSHRQEFTVKYYCIYNRKKRDRIRVLTYGEMETRCVGLVLSVY